MTKISPENIERIHLVVRYIEQSIDKDLPLDELAAKACFSPFHFQRVFKEVLGETPKQFIKRLRLEEAARIIAFQPELNILEVAYKVGFQSLESFSRAFKDYYSVSPDNYRKCTEIERINITQVPYRHNIQGDEPKLEISFTAHNPEFSDLQVDIVKRPLQRCVYLQTTLLSPHLIRENFKRIKQWAQARDLITGNTSVFGLVKDFPIFTSLDRCRFLTCISVDSTVNTSGLVSYMETPSAKYATIQVEGGVSEVIKTSSFLVHSWMPENGYKLKLEPIIQIPLKDPASAHFNENSYQIYIPVQPL
jgi:AraC family transcriptional regulator